MFRSSAPSKEQKKSKKSKIFEFFRFLLPFDVFSSLSVSLHKKKKIFRTPEDSSQSLSFALRASEYARIKDHHHGAFCDDDDMGDDAIVVLFILFVFVVIISLSLSLSLSLLSRD